MRSEIVDSWTISYDAGQATHRTTDGCELYYELRGSGPQITFVSTIYAVSTAWRNFTERLVANHRILTYDLRNQGASSAHAGKFMQHTDDLASLLDALHIERTYLVGTSISTLICRDFAVTHPDRVAGMVLVGPSFSPHGSFRRRRIARSWLAALDDGGPRRLFDLIYPLVFGDRALAEGGPGTYMALRERFLAMNSQAQLRANLAEALDASDEVELLEKITAPTLLLAGDDDFSTTATTLEAVARRMLNAQVEIIPECGHLPYFEATECFETLVAKFVATVEATQRKGEISERAMPKRHSASTNGDVK